MKRHTALALLFSICLFFLWQALHSFGPIKFRGTYPLVSDAQVSQTLDSYNNQASVCNDLPACFRPLTSWIILTVHHTVSRLFVSIGKLPHIFSFHEQEYGYYRVIDFASFPVSAASQIVITVAYVTSFSLLILHLGGWLGFVAGSAFGLVPLAGFIGLTQSDGIELLYWSCFIIFCARALPSPHHRLPIRNHSSTGAALIGLLWGVVGSLLHENMGIAVSIALFCIALYCTIINRSGRAWWIMYGSSTISTLATLGALWIAGHRHSDASWIEPGGDLTAVWTVYSQYDQLSLLLTFAGRILFFPTIVGVLTLVYLLFKRPRFNKTQTQTQTQSAILPAVAALIGFSCTALAGLWLGAGFRGEWPKQLLPLAFCFTWVIFSAIQLFSERYTRPYSDKLRHHK
jgi:hypothetical protein